jgi:rhamnogalacturonyl hydrolase YesR
LAPLLAAGLLAFAPWCARAQSSTPPAPSAVSSAALAPYFGDWPAGASPLEVGKRVTENLLARPFRYETTNKPYVVYPEVIAWYGALTFAKVAPDPDLTAKLIARFDPFLTPDGAEHISQNNHVDYHVFGAVPLEIYIETKDKKYLVLGQGFADREQANVFTPDGYSSEARFWVDDLYMLPLVQVEAYRATGDKKYLTTTAQLFSDYLDKLQQPNGLFHHGLDAPYFWSRGNGWVAAGLAELLRDLPADNPHYPRLMDGYKKMMAALLKCQGDDGLWRELLDHPEGWSETSGSGMFTFALVTGVKNGWLDASTYGPAARKAWLGLVKDLDQNANLSNVCPGTNKWTPAQGDPVAYYLGRKPISGANLNTFDELHGLAPLLWTATALLR